MFLKDLILLIHEHSGMYVVLILKDIEHIIKLQRQAAIKYRVNEIVNLKRMSSIKYRAHCYQIILKLS